MSKVDRDGDRQFGALPYRYSAGSTQVLLITSRGSGRWIIPKGWPILGRKGRQVAALEAKEEAGVVGTIGKRPLGLYSYEKALADGDRRLVTVTVYPLLVTDELSAWSEAAERQRRWFTKTNAAALISEAPLARIMRDMI